MNIIISGGTRGIGRDVALYLAQDKENRILVTGRNQSALDNMRNQNKNILTFRIDLSEFGAYSESFINYVAKNLKTIDILINMAGFLVAKKFDEVSESDAREMMEINFFGPAAIIKRVKPYMNTGSHIVNISSMGGFQGSVKFAGLSYYSASKAALSTLSECLSGEFQESKISVNCLALGAVETEMLEEAFPGYVAPVKSKDMAVFISDFAINGHRFINGKVIPVAINNP